MNHYPAKTTFKSKCNQDMKDRMGPGGGIAKEEAGDE